MRLKLRELRLERKSGQKSARRTLETKQPKEPSEDDEERLRLAHVFEAWYEAGFLWWTVEQAEVVVVNGEDFVFGTLRAKRG